MLKGINQWCYPEGTPIEKVFEYSKNAGFDAVELNVNEAGGKESHRNRREKKSRKSRYGFKV